jgi:hypothetical protein
MKKRFPAFTTLLIGKSDDGGRRIVPEFAAFSCVAF